MEKLKQFLDDIISLPDQDWRFIRQKLQGQSLEKGDCVIQAGEQEDKVYFIEEGIFRLYVPLEEKDVIIDFRFENDLMSSYTSFLTQTPSVLTIEALTTAHVNCITAEDLKAIYEYSEVGQALGRVLTEQLFMMKSKRELSFLIDSPTERYYKLFDEHPHFIQQIPQKYLASYIGVTPQALSRIRSRVS